MTKVELEALLQRWTLPPSDTEDERAENACRIVSDAVRGSDLLQGRLYRVFTQGSYRNNTNVRLESDVDVCVCLTGTVNNDYTYTPGLSDQAIGLLPATYTAQEFKNDVEVALVAAFGARNVGRGDKAINIKANTYRVTADVVPCIEHRRHYQNALVSPAVGISIYTDSGRQINNFPDHHHHFGVEKNKRTNGYYKRTARIFKNLRNAMAAEGSAEAEAVPSFLNECLAWNVPDEILMLGNWDLTVRNSLASLYQQLQDPAVWPQMQQVSQMFPLFHGSNGFSVEVARRWLQAAWNRLGFQ
jgi:hypothetical protein